MQPTDQSAALRIEFGRDPLGWTAGIPALPGIAVHGRRTRKQALADVEAMALGVIADRHQRGEAAPATVSFGVKLAKLSKTEPVAAVRPVSHATAVRGYALYRGQVLFGGGRDLLLAHDVAKEASADGGEPVSIEGPGVLRGREVIAVYVDGKRLLTGAGRNTPARRALVAKATAAVAGT